MHRSMIIGLLVVVAAVAQSGCGGEGDGGSAARPLEERQAISADAPTAEAGTLDSRGPYNGVWSAEITLQELGEAAGDTRYAGPFRIDLREDGTYETQQTLDGTQSGEYRAAPGDFLVFKDDTGCDYSGKFSGTSVYRWSVDGDELTLTLVRPESGGCTGRSDTLTLPRWERG